MQRGTAARSAGVAQTPTVRVTCITMHRIATFIWQRLHGLVPGELKQTELAELVWPQHTSLLASRRATMIVNRVRLFAFLFALLTPLWTLVDLAVFPLPLWGGLALMRLFAAAAFFSLLLYYQPDGDLFDAYRAMALLFLIPTVFYVASYTLLGYFQLKGVSAALGAGYAFLPFALLSGLAIFPLTLLESLVIASPILLAQGLAGWLRWTSLDWPSFAGAFWLLLLIASVSTLASMSQLAFMIALVRQAIRDPLTGVFSRSSADEVLALQFTSSSRSGAPLAIAFIDLDHFKSINDTFGHEAGDKTLMAMTRMIGQQLRQGDLLARWGGEEFLLIMPNTDLAQAHAAMLRMRSLGFGQRPDNTPLTACVGIAERCADHATHWKALVDLADQRMYQAKAAGRDTVCSGPSHGELT